MKVELCAPPVPPHVPTRRWSERDRRHRRRRDDRSDDGHDDRSYDSRDRSEDQYSSDYESDESGSGSRSYSRSTYDSRSMTPSGSYLSSEQRWETGARAVRLWGACRQLVTGRKSTGIFTRTHHGVVLTRSRAGLEILSSPAATCWRARFR